MHVPAPKQRFLNRDAVLSGFLIALMLLFYFLFLAHRIDLSIADLGRHLKNGEMMLAGEWAALKTNFYSYTAADFRIPNHHWASGLFFYLAWYLAGFTGVQLAFIALSLGALFIMLRIAVRSAGPGPAALLVLMVLPLLAERTEIRPEVFTYFFGAVFLWTLLRFMANGSRRPLFVLPILEILWVNSHIYFIMGPALVGVFLIGSLFERPFKRDKTKTLGLILLATAAATIFNPSGPNGALAPFTVFQNYGYRVAENQPVWFIEKLLSNPNFTIFKIVFGLLAASLIARLAFVRPLVRTLSSDKGAVAQFILAALMGTLGWLATRNFALFGLFFIPLAAANLAAIMPNWLAANSRRIKIAALAAGVILIIPAFWGHWQRYFPYWREFGLGLENGASASAEFFKTQSLRGPIFNNYDLGGYLVWHLFPGERVFVDNRPEAYPAEFFRDVYIPMQENEDVWRAQLERRQFNAIFFSHRDMTPWGQKFLVSRVDDPQWAPVFADKYAIIFLKRNETNASIIEKFEIPRNTFRVVRKTN